MLTFLLVVHAIITAILVVVILMQRSEGGGLGMGGSPTGLMSARGAADFLTRATTILATLFVLLAIASAVVASRSGAPGKVDTSLQRTATPGDIAPPAAPPGTDPLSAVAGQVGNAPAPAPVTTPTPAPLVVPPAKGEAPAPKGTPKAAAPTRPAARETSAAPAAPPPVAPTTLPSIPSKANASPAPTGPSNSN